MKADKDDAPYHLRNKRDSHWRLLAILGIGSAVTWAAIFMFAKPITIDVGQLQNAIQIGDQDAARQQRLEEEKARALAKILAEQPSAAPHQTTPGMHAYRPAPQPAEQQPRQTVFNDRNYSPRTDINTMEGVKLGMVSEPKRQKVRTRRGPEHWKWESSTNSGSGWFYWDEVDGRIDWNTVCKNEKYGSFRYRDCRKGAKVTFARLCSNYQPACMAENHYRPL